MPSVLVWAVALGSPSTYAVIVPVRSSVTTTSIQRPVGTVAFRPVLAPAPMKRSVLPGVMSMSTPSVPGSPDTWESNRRR